MHQNSLRINARTRYEYSLTAMGFKEDIVVAAYTGQTYRITVVLDADWLADPKTVYPITIDPSVDLIDINSGSAKQSSTCTMTGSISITS